jgi:hypothetical protein
MNQAQLDSGYRTALGKQIWAMESSMACARRQVAAPESLLAYANRESPAAVYYKKMAELSIHMHLSANHPERLRVWWVEQGVRYLRWYCPGCWHLFGNLIGQKGMSKQSLDGVLECPGSLDRDPAISRLKNAHTAEIAELEDQMNGFKQKNLEFRSAHYKDFYNSYIQSPAWAAKRRAVIKRCGNICEGCGAAQVDEVHHLHYGHLGDELLFELVGLCRACHEKAHKPGVQAQYLGVV